MVVTYQMSLFYTMSNLESKESFIVLFYTTVAYSFYSYNKNNNGRYNYYIFTDRL